VVNIPDDIRVQYFHRQLHILNFAAKKCRTTTLELKTCQRWQ